MLFKSSTCPTFLQCHTLDITMSVINKLYSHCWDVLPRKGICGVADQQACLTNRTARKQNIVSVQGVPPPLRSQDMMGAVQSQCSRLISIKPSQTLKSIHNNKNTICQYTTLYYSKSKITIRFGCIYKAASIGPYVSEMSNENYMAT